MIKLYTNHCPKCEILTAKLRDKNVSFLIEDNEEFLISSGFDYLPILEVDGEKLDYLKAINYVNSL